MLGKSAGQQTGWIVKVDGKAVSAVVEGFFTIHALLLVFGPFFFGAFVSKNGPSL